MRFSLFVLVLPFVTPPSISAQTISGRLIDDASGAAVAEADVALRNADGVVVDAAVTANDGAFTLHADEPGRYVIRAMHVGYARTTSPVLELDDGETLDVEFRIAAQVVLLAPLTVTARRRRAPAVRDRRLERWGYYERKAEYGKEGNGLGWAYFLEGDDIRPTAFRLTDVLRDLSGIYVHAAGGRNVTVTGRRGCALTYYLDGVSVGGSLEVPPIAILAIEVYTNNVRPAQFQGGRVQQSLGMGGPNCGAVVVWTGNRRLR